MDIHRFVNQPPDPISTVRTLYFTKYKQTLDTNFLGHTLTPTNIIVIRNTVKIINELQTLYGQTMFVFETMIVQLQIKLFQYSLILEELTDDDFCFDANLPHLKTAKNFFGGHLGIINYDVDCDEKLVLYRDFVVESMQELCALMLAVETSKDDVLKLYRISVGGSVIVCGVCQEDCVNGFRTECGHDFCYECFVKSQSVKNACPVCRNVKSFKYNMEKKDNLLQRIRTVYSNSKLSWTK
jgi:hypothetical protein